MKIPDEHMVEFIRLYEVKYGVTLEYQDAYDKASKLLRLVEIVESNGIKSNDLKQNPVL